MFGREDDRHFVVTEFEKAKTFIFNDFVFMRLSSDDLRTINSEKAERNDNDDNDDDDDDDNDDEDDDDDVKKSKKHFLKITHVLTTRHRTSKVKTWRKQRKRKKKRQKSWER